MQCVQHVRFVASMQEYVCNHGDCIGGVVLVGVYAYMFVSL